MNLVILGLCGMAAEILLGHFVPLCLGCLLLTFQPNLEARAYTIIVKEVTEHVPCTCT